jgi:hypothetical protein
MSENDEKPEQEKQQQQEKQEKVESCEHKSERRTAAFITRRLDGVQDQLFDLMADMRTFEHYSEIEDVGWCLMLMQRLKHKYRSFAEDGVWPGR